MCVRWFIVTMLIVVAITVPGCSKNWSGEAPLQRFERDGLVGYQDVRGEIVIEPRFYLAGEFSDAGIAAVADEDGWGYVDREGTIVIRPFVYDNAPDEFRAGLARFREGGKFGYFDERGQVVIEAKFDFAAPFHDGLAAMCEGCSEQDDGEHLEIVGGRWGYLDRQGRLVIPPRFEQARPFADGRARVMLNGAWTAIDKSGRLVE